MYLLNKQINFKNIFIYIFIYLISFFISKLFLIEIVDRLFINNIKVITLNASDVVLILFEMSVIIFFFLGIPYFTYNFYKSNFDAMYSKEQKVFSKLLWFYLIGMFGALFGFYISVEYLIPSLYGYNVFFNIDSTITLSSLVWFVINNMVLFFFVIQLPFIMRLLSKLEIVSKHTFRKNWRYALAFAIIISVPLSPAEPLSMFIFAVPLSLSYLLGII